MPKYSHARYFTRLSGELDTYGNTAMAHLILSHLQLQYKFNSMAHLSDHLAASMKDFRNLAESYRLPKKEIENIEIIFEDLRSQIDISTDFQIIGENGRYRLKRKEG